MYIRIHIHIHIHLITSTRSGCSEGRARRRDRWCLLRPRHQGRRARRTARPQSLDPKSYEPLQRDNVKIGHPDGKMSSPDRFTSSRLGSFCSLSLQSVPKR